MGARGRKPGSELSVVQGKPAEITERPTPPSDLTQDQADVWYSVVNRLPADWFPEETHGLLAQYCRHVVSSSRISQLIKLHEQAEECDINEYDQLLKMQEREGRAISSLATRMRLTQQATYDPKKSKGKSGKRPWES